MSYEPSNERNPDIRHFSMCSIILYWTNKVIKLYTNMAFAWIWFLYDVWLLHHSMTLFVKLCFYLPSNSHWKAVVREIMECRFGLPLRYCMVWSFPMFSLSYMYWNIDVSAWHFLHSREKSILQKGNMKRLRQGKQ